MFWITDEEHALDGVERGAGQLGKGVGGGGCALRVALQDEALVGVARQSRLDLPDDVGGAGSRVLRGVGGVDGVVDFASGELALDVRVHGSKASTRPLCFARSTGVDDGVARAGILPLNDTGLGSRRSGKGEEEVLELHLGGDLLGKFAGEVVGWLSRAGLWCSSIF